MKLLDILEQVDTLVPNAIQTKQKISWINQIQRELFRDYPVPDAVYPFVTDGQEFYVLPPDCAEDRIQQLVIDKRVYDYSPMILQTTNVRYFAIVAEQIVVYPTPAANLSAFLYYRPRPVDLTEDDLDKEPMFPEDFHELLVLGCAARVAKTIPEMKDLAMMYSNDFAELSEKARRRITKPKQRKVNLTRRWG